MLVLLHLNTPSKGSRIKMKKCSKSISQSDNGSSIGLGLLNGSSSYDATAAEEAEFNRLMKKEKG